MQSMHAKIGETHAPLSVCVDGSLSLTTMYICALLLMEPQAAAVAIHTHVDSLAHGRIRE